MARFCIATMDTRWGWETESTSNAISLHLTYFWAARENQDKVLGGVRNFYSLFEQYGGTPETLMDQLKTTLTAYMQEQWDDVLINVDRVLLPNEANNYKLIMSGVVVSDGVRYDLAETILVTGETYRVLTNERLKR